MVCPAGTRPILSAKAERVMVCPAGTRPILSAKAERVMVPSVGILSVGFAIEKTAYLFGFPRPRQSFPLE